MVKKSDSGKDQYASEERFGQFGESLSELLDPVSKQPAELASFERKLPAGGRLVGTVLKYELAPEVAAHQLRLAQMDVDRSIELATIEQKTEEIKVEGAKEVARLKYVVPMRIASGPVWATVVLSVGVVVYALYASNTVLAVAALGALVGLSYLTKFLPTKSVD